MHSFMWNAIQLQHYSRLSCYVGIRTTNKIKTVVLRTSQWRRDRTWSPFVWSARTEQADSQPSGPHTSRSRHASETAIPRLRSLWCLVCAYTHTRIRTSTCTCTCTSIKLHLYKSLVTHKQLSTHTTTSCLYIICARIHVMCTCTTIWSTSHSTHVRHSCSDANVKVHSYSITHRAGLRLLSGSPRQ